MRGKRTRTARTLALLAALTLLAAACLGGEGGDGDGSTVTVIGAFTADEETAFRDSIASWEEETGNTIEYEGSSDFETLVVSRFEGGSPPDVALFPQPGLLLDLAEGGDLTPLSEIDTLPGDLDSLFVEGFLDAAATDDGTRYGIPYRMAVKSAVWYPIPEYEEAGYPIPTTFDEFRSALDTIREDGETPLLIGAEAGGSTGWVFTDWVEEMVLRFAGPEAYDQWVSHEIPFNDPQIVESARVFEEIATTEGNVLGGLAGTVNIPFGAASDPMFEDPPGGFLTRQGNFITGFFPDDVQEDLDANVGVFRFPGGASGGYEGDPVLGGGDIATRSTTESAAADEFLAFLTEAEASTEWAGQGGFLSPLLDYPLDAYPNEITRDLATLATEADVFRFDASDLMPGAVGTGSFWSEMVEWATGSIDLQTALDNIEESWPETTE